MTIRELSVKKLAQEIGLSTDTTRPVYRNRLIPSRMVETALRFDPRKVHAQI